MFHRRWYHPNNTLIAIVGDVSVGRPPWRAVEKAFGDWPRGDGAGITAPIRPTRPGASSSSIGRARCRPQIRVGQLAIRRDHQDYMPLNLAVKILGGEGGNRLQAVLRSDRGLTYGASADMDAFQRSGAIVADTDTRTETTIEALRLTVDEFIRLQQEAVQRARAGRRRRPSSPATSR